jgi:hypothetical protein
MKKSTKEKETKEYYVVDCDQLLSKRYDSDPYLDNFLKLTSCIRAIFYLLKVSEFAIDDTLFNKINPKDRWMFTNKKSNKKKA